MRTAALVLVALVGCKGGGPNDKAKDKECPKADQDPDWVHVDRDQLTAMCLASKLPPLTWASDPAALIAPDGKRIPWLLLWSDADAPAEEKVPHAAEWVKAARERLRIGQAETSSPRDESKRSGREWLNILCRGDEERVVVITGALFEKKGAHAIAIRGDQLLDETLPPDAKPADVFAKAIELTNKLAGGPVQLVKHTLVSEPMYLDVADPWREALHITR